MSKGQQRLGERLTKPIARAGVGEVYLWLLAHRDTIDEARALGIKWSEIIQAAREDGVTMEDCRSARISIQKSWKRVQRAWIVETQRRIEIENARAAARARTANSQVMPSRLPASWRPQFVESVESASPRPDPTDASQSAAATLKKSALMTTNSHMAASSNAGMTPAIPEGKTLADIAAEEMERQLRIEANRRAGYFGDK
ncbi:hypothetical protein [Kozakia baliensis]|uniref:Uncharacterized protein n=1 Tax=Kozakia baliensis TaxID=153496 RepID=A0A1D8UZ04_9PROT|nr:hypothetical protein [Kozakia baliensis]AOX18880.1 hypothetical protein A0U89_16415 [Kozakia baliensis]GBR27883.1 hypothetical protein AA0488_1269 [Kozakia baliensis NRIC 0488]GEL65341.1 hypothetical protein KBA01_26270 [Kozakia baliensis]